MPLERKDAEENSIDWESLTNPASLEQVQVPTTEEKEINWTKLKIEEKASDFSAPVDTEEREIDWSRLKQPSGD